MSVRNLSGMRFGRWLAISRIGPLGPRRRSKWLCRCDCGQERYVDTANLTTGMSRSCGCLFREIRKTRAVTHGETLNRVRSPEYRAWRQMKTRCLNPKNKSFRYYGGRGITIAPAWREPDGFKPFLDYIGRRPSSQHSLDRINNDGNYEPGNVRWATWSEQAKNRRPQKRKTA